MEEAKCMCRKNQVLNFYERLGVQGDILKDSPAATTYPPLKAAFLRALDRGRGEHAAKCSLEPVSGRIRPLKQLWSPRPPAVSMRDLQI